MPKQQKKLNDMIVEKKLVITQSAPNIVHRIERIKTQYLDGKVQEQYLISINDCAGYDVSSEAVECLIEDLQKIKKAKLEI